MSHRMVFGGVPVRATLWLLGLGMIGAKSGSDGGVNYAGSRSCHIGINIYLCLGVECSGWRGRRGRRGQIADHHGSCQRILLLLTETNLSLGLSIEIYSYAGGQCRVLSKRRLTWPLNPS